MPSSVPHAGSDHVSACSRMSHSTTRLRITVPTLAFPAEQERAYANSTASERPSLALVGTKAIKGLPGYLEPFRIE